MASVALARSVARLERAIAMVFPESEFELVRDEEDRNAWGLYVYSNAASRQIRDVVLNHIARILIEEHYALYVVAVPKEPVDRSVGAMMKQPLGTPVHLTRDQALAIVEAGIGGRPELPTGTEYVRHIREAWRGLTGRG